MSDVIVPLTPTVAAVGGVGYESIKATQRDVLLDVAGNPVVDSNNRFVTDPASPRRLAYDQSGIYWDVGVVWRPNQRTSLEARVGRRYGSWSYTGSFASQLSESTAVQVGVYDEVQTFGQQLSGSLSRLPTAFAVSRNPFGNQSGGCVFGAAGGPAGSCLNSTLQSISTSVYRTRGVTGVLSSHRGPWSYGIGGGYSNRKFLTPTTGTLTLANGTQDQNYFIDGYVDRKLTAQSGVNFNAYANWYDSGLSGAPNVLGTGATGSYYRTFGERLSGVASLGLYSSRQEGFDSSLIGSALLGMRYSF
jgi:hypothetical protein